MGNKHYRFFALISEIHFNAELTKDNMYIYALFLKFFFESENIG